MSRKAWIGLAAAIVTLGTSWVAWRVALAAADAEMDMAALRAEREAMANAQRRLQAKLDAAEAQRRALEAALAQVHATPAAKKDAAPAARLSNLNITDAILVDPKLQVLQLESRRAEFRARYGPLIQGMHLTDAQVTKLAEARVTSVGVAMDIQGVMAQQKLASNDPAIQELRRRATEELRSAQVEALGEDGYAKLKEYEHTLPARETISRLAGAAALNGTPLSAEQAERMTAILAAASASGREGVNIATIDWAAVDLQAQGVLSAPQLALFQQTEPIGGGASRWSAQMDQAMNAARRELRAPGK